MSTAGRVRRCVEQTVAAEALEGWRPTEDQLAALTAVAGGEVTFDGYLAAYLSAHPVAPAPPRRRQSRHDPPYLVAGTSLLRNNFGASDHETLADLEFVATAGRMACWHRRLADGDVGPGDLDVRELHRQLFGDVYEWAGHYRVCELGLGDEVFARRSSVPQRMDRLKASARAMLDDAHDTEDPLADRLAALYAEYNYVHPFREGNGRTGTLLLHAVATLRGRRLDFGVISRAQWYAASRASMPVSARRNGAADHRPFVALLDRALG